jgi:putative nucleotidyltransferase with HDIG domain
MFNEVATRLLERIALELSAPDVVFPTSFDLTIRVQALLKDPNVSIEKLAEFIRTEPLMSSKIIAYANSAALRGIAGEIMDLQPAILRIGLDAVRTVSYSLAVEQIIRSKHMMPFHDLSNAIWEHSLTVASIAKQLARRIKLNPEKAFFLGLVHDLGAFYLLFRCSEDAALAADRSQLLELVFEWHDGVGHALLSAMGQPEDVVTAVQDHETPVTIANLNTWTALIACADLLSQPISDWVPAELRERKPRKLSASLFTDLELAEIETQAREGLASLRAALH